MLERAEAFCTHIGTHIHSVCSSHIPQCIMYSTAFSTPAENCSNGELRLEGTSDDTQANTREGRVEICINNAWGTICDTLFGSKEAEVACGQLEGFQINGKCLDLLVSIVISILHLMQVDRL